MSLSSWKDVRGFPKSKENKEYLEEAEAFVADTTEMHKCGCKIRYYVNQDGAFVRDRDWCKTHFDAMQAELGITP